MTIQISIKDDASARQWLMMVEGINQDYHQAMKDAGDCLEHMQDFCDGTMVDEFVGFGNAMLTAADKTFDTIKLVADTVNTVLGKAKDFQDTVVSGIKGIAKIFG